jgi:hypothetical protein
VVTVYGAPPRLAFPENATLCLSGIAHTERGTLAFLDECQGYLLELRAVAAVD